MKVKVIKKPVRKAERACKKNDIRVITETELRAAVKKLNTFFENNPNFGRLQPDCLLSKLIDTLLGDH